MSKRKPRPISLKTITNRLYRLSAAFKKIQPSKMMVSDYQRVQMSNVRIGYESFTIDYKIGKKQYKDVKISLHQLDKVPLAIRERLGAEVSSMITQTALKRAQMQTKEGKIPKRTKFLPTEDVEAIKQTKGAWASDDELDRFVDWLEDDDQSRGTNKNLYYHDFGATRVSIPQAVMFVQTFGFDTITEFLDHWYKRESEVIS